LPDCFFENKGNRVSYEPVIIKKIFGPHPTTRQRAIARQKVATLKKKGILAQACDKYNLQYQKVCWWLIKYIKSTQCRHDEVLVKVLETEEGTTIA